MKKYLALLFIFLLLFISGCETVKGLGKDIQNVGQWAQDKVN